MSHKIVVADDESHIVNVLALKLTNAGHEVFVARDGGEAFEAVVRERPAMLITDFHMPVMSGVELCTRLRAEGEFAGVALLLTARGNDLSEQELARSGIAEVLSKPFSPRQIAEVVARHLEKHAA